MILKLFFSSGCGRSACGATLWCCNYSNYRKNECSAPTKKWESALNYAVQPEIRLEQHQMMSAFDSSNLEKRLNIQMKMEPGTNAGCLFPCSSQNRYIYLILFQLRGCIAFLYKCTYF